MQRINFNKNYEKSQERPRTILAGFTGQRERERERVKAVSLKF